MCQLTNITLPTLDAFVRGTIQQVLIGDHKTTEKAIDTFVKAILAPMRAEPKRAKSNERDLDLLNRKIKATFGMLADPTFDGMDELQSTLADLKAKRDALNVRMKPQAGPANPEPTEAELRTWALKQFAGLHELTTRTEITLPDRQLVEAYVERIEIDPEAKIGVVILAGGLENAYREGSTHLPTGGMRDKTEGVDCLSQPQVLHNQCVDVLFGCIEAVIEFAECFVLFQSQCLKL